MRVWTLTYTPVGIHAHAHVCFNSNVVHMHTHIRSKQSFAKHHLHLYKQAHTYTQLHYSGAQKVTRVLPARHTARLRHQLLEDVPHLSMRLFSVSQIPLLRGVYVCVYRYTNYMCIYACMCVYVCVCTGCVCIYIHEFRVCVYVKMCCISTCCAFDCCSSASKLYVRVCVCINIRIRSTYAQILDTTCVCI